MAFLGQHSAQSSHLMHSSLRLHRVGRDRGVGENGNETDPGPELGREDALVHPDRAQAGVFCRRDVAEGGQVILPEGPHGGVGVAGEGERGVPHAVEIARELHGQIVELAVRRRVEFLVEGRRCRLHDGQRHGHADDDDGARLREDRPGPEIRRHLAVLVPTLHGGKPHEIRVSFPAESDDVVLECLVLEGDSHFSSP